MNYKKTLKNLRAKMVSEITEIMESNNVGSISLRNSSNVGISVPYFNPSGTTLMEYIARELQLENGVVYVIISRRSNNRIPLADMHCNLLDFYAIGKIYDFVTKKIKD